MLYLSQKINNCEHNIFRSLTGLLIVSCWLLVSANLVHAQPVETEYELLAPLPLSGPTSAPDDTTTATDYIKGFFNLAIAIAGGLAVIKIIFGGIKYMSTDAFSGKSEAKGTIQNAIWGFLLAISAWLILNTINPDLTTFNLNIQRQTIPENTNIGAGRADGIPMTPAEIAADAAVRQSLPNGVIVVSGPCLRGRTRGCVNLNGIQPSVIAGLAGLHNACGCTVRITGGTEGGHSSHGSGTAVDISADPEIHRVVVGNRIARACNTYTYGGASYLWEPRGSTCGAFPSTGVHWHVQF